MWTVVLLTSIALNSQWDLLAAEEYALENRHLGLFQGDILISNRTYFTDRNAIVNLEGRWPGGQVVYALADTYSDSDREVIQSAIEEFEKHTCIRWVERTDEDVYVEIENGMGCYSSVGREGGVQSLSLQAPFCMTKGLVMHEMMHTLGFLHEHTRADRDAYVRVIWDNIVPGQQSNFQKLNRFEIDDLGFDYDYRSVMHYTAYTFANDRSKPTLRPYDSDVTLQDLGEGRREGFLTDTDIQKINKFYECPTE